ncbi:MAG: hypothetical protein J0M34_00790 [Alphaproteobacteria bacterium]|nr:hypothetical protein [Alphaproteobacteria bacterium]
MTIHVSQKLLRLAARSDFSSFLRMVIATVSPAARYQHNWHIDAIAAHLDACARGEIRRLIINMPPRMLKSITVSVAWPAWLLGQDARTRLMVASYAQSPSIKHSTDCRLVMQSAWYRAIFPHTELAYDQNEKDKFVTTRRGHRIATSVGGAATGEGGNILIVDDPLNPLQAQQRTMREAANQWFDHTFASRLDDKKRGAIVVVMQRLHAEDLSGYLMQRGGWEVLSLPAISTARTTITCGRFTKTREVGEVLHAAREDAEMLEQVKCELGSANFNAQYQQAPVGEDDGMIKLAWFARF